VASRPEWGRCCGGGRGARQVAAAADAVRQRAVDSVAAAALPVRSPPPARAMPRACSAAPCGLLARVRVRAAGGLLLRAARPSRTVPARDAHLCVARPSAALRTHAPTHAQPIGTRWQHTRGHNRAGVPRRPMEPPLHTGPARAARAARPNAASSKHQAAAGALAPAARLGPVRQPSTSPRPLRPLLDALLAPPARAFTACAWQAAAAAAAALGGDAEGTLDSAADMSNGVDSDEVGGGGAHADARGHTRTQAWLWGVGDTSPS
jgi:hypothetical protein